MSKDLIFQTPDNFYVVIPIELLESLSKYRQISSSQPESGGVLIGCVRGDGDIELLSATGPFNEDKRNRYGFFRSSVQHIKIAWESWRNSKGTDSYIGEWHTHPEDFPTPSSIDIRSWKNQLPKRVSILIILGRKAEWYGLCNAEGNVSELIPVPQ